MNRTERSRAGMGTLCVMLSALIFGVTPIMAKWTYAGGSNAVNLTLLRSLLALPVLLVLALRQPGGLRVGRYAALPLGFDYAAAAYADRVASEAHRRGQRVLSAGAARSVCAVEVEGNAG